MDDRKQDGLLDVAWGNKKAAARWKGLETETEGVKLEAG